MVLTIVNSTNYNAFGRMVYSAGFCGSGSYSVRPGGKWQIIQFDGCFVIEVKASLLVGHKQVPATPYDTGGPYSNFAIIQTSSDPLGFAVIGVASTVADQVPTEPTTQQE